MQKAGKQNLLINVQFESRTGISRDMEIMNAVTCREIDSLRQNLGITVKILNAVKEKRLFVCSFIAFR